MARLSLIPLSIACAALVCGQSLVPTSSPKYKEVRKVYDRLVRASGSARTPPRLLMTAGMPQGRDPGLLALFNGDTVQFSEFVYDQCTTAQGPSDDCLSVLLGHELAHFYEGHLWKQDLALGALPDSWIAAQTAATPAQIKAAAERHAIESQADYAGGVLSFQAGFDPTAHAVALLKAIYDEFQIADKEKALPADAHPYPELEERIAIAQATSHQLHDVLYPVFETGIQLFLAGDYKSSAQCFDYIGKTFVSREILNNAAAAYIMVALRIDPNLGGGYSWPVQIDFDTRLKRVGEAGGRGDDDSLNDAESRLDNALRLDSSYPPAVLNMAIVKGLERDPEASALADRAVVLAQSSGHADWSSRAAVLHKLLDDRAHNVAPPPPSTSPPISTPAAVPPPQPDSFTSKIVLRTRSAYETGLELRLYPDARALVENGVKYLAVLRTAPPLNIAADRDPIRTYAARQGEYRLYANPSLLVFIDANGKPAEWTLLNPQN